MASVISSLPGQQQPGEIEQQPNPETVSGAPWHSPGSGSIGPFFAVISVLAVLAILSCFLSRICTRQERNSLNSIDHRGCLGVVKRKSRWRLTGDVEVGGKVMALSEEKQNGTTKDDAPQNPPHP